MFSSNVSKIRDTVWVTLGILNEKCLLFVVVVDDDGYPSLQ